MGSRLGRKEEENGRDERVEIVIHICMETIQGNSLCSYLYLKLVNTIFLFLSFMFLLYKI
jgi:hypothetical protein